MGLRRLPVASAGTQLPAPTAMDIAIATAARRLGHLLTPVTCTTLTSLGSDVNPSSATTPGHYGRPSWARRPSQLNAGHDTTPPSQSSLSSSLWATPPGKVHPAIDRGQHQTRLAPRT